MPATRGRRHRIAGLCALGALLLGIGELGAGGTGVTLSTCTFLAGGGLVPPGLYARAGLAWLPGRRLELELFHIPQLTPRPYSRVYWGAAAGWWLIERRRAAYFNMTVDAGILYAAGRGALLAWRFSPIVLGGPQYRFADRFLTVGALFDPAGGRLAWQLQLLGITLYL